MMEEDALKVINGVISSTHKCYVCEEKYGWNAPFNNDVHQLNNKLQTARLIAEDTCMYEGGKKAFADVSVIVTCPHCGIINKLRHVKINLKE